MINIVHDRVLKDILKNRYLFGGIECKDLTLYNTEKS